MIETKERDGSSSKLDLEHEKLMQDIERRRMLMVLVSLFGILPVCHFSSCLDAIVKIRKSLSNDVWECSDLVWSTLLLLATTRASKK